MRWVVIIAVLLVGPTLVWGEVQTFCSDIAGNIACTSYDSGASSQTYCTSIAGNLSCTTYGHTDQYNQVQIQHNYAVGAAIGSAIGNLVVGAIEGYREHKRQNRSREDAWNQYVQDVLAASELNCETEPTHERHCRRVQNLHFLFSPVSRQA